MESARGRAFNGVVLVSRLRFRKNPAFTPRASAAQLDGSTASPTPAPSSAPRTETTTAAPASVHSSHPEVRLLRIPPSQSFFFILCINIGLLLTYSCAVGCYIILTSCLELSISRLVVRGLWPVQPERHLLPQLLQRGALQRHQVVLLEGSEYDGYHDDHDGAPDTFQKKKTTRRSRRRVVEANVIPDE